jgi:hypothetical protein
LKCKGTRRRIHAKKVDRLFDGVQRIRVSSGPEQHIAPVVQGRGQPGSIADVPADGYCVVDVVESFIPAPGSEIGTGEVVVSKSSRELVPGLLRRTQHQVEHRDGVVKVSVRVEEPPHRSRQPPDVVMPAAIEADADRGKQVEALSIEPDLRGVR